MNTLKWIDAQSFKIILTTERPEIMYSILNSVEFKTSLSDSVIYLLPLYYLFVGRYVIKNEWGNI